MAAFSRKSGFTLLETLISIAIIVVILGAAIASNRVITDSSALQLSVSQMDSLAEEGISEVQFLRDSLPTGTSVASYFGLNDSAADATVYGTFHSNLTNLSGCSSGNCPQAEAGGPVLLTWCTAGSTCTVGPTTVVSPIKLNDSIATCPNDNGDCSLSKMFVVPAIANSEVIGLRVTKYAALDNSCDASAGVSENADRMMADAASQLNDPAANHSCISTYVSSQPNKNWNFYTRLIKITQPAAAVCGACSTTNLQFNGDSGGPLFNAALRPKVYVVNVTVTDYFNPENTITKSSLLMER